MKKLPALFATLCLTLGLLGCQQNNDQSSVESTPVQEQTSSAEIHSNGTAPSEENFQALAVQYAAAENDRGYNFVSIQAKKSFPAIYITTIDETKILSREEYVAAMVDVINCDEAYTFSATAGLKVRGNSTADQGDEKPYRIKFTEKQSMLGLNEGQAYKDWVLLRSYWNLCPDYTAFQLADLILGDEYYHSDCAYVNLYINGESAGIYLLCEHTQAKEGRIDVYEPSKDENQTEIGYLLELDNYAGEDEFITVSHGSEPFTDINDESRAFLDKNYSIKSKTRSNAQIQFIEKYMNGVYEILRDAVEQDKILMFDASYNVVDGSSVYASPKEAVNAIIDLKSLANMLILEEMCQNYDVGEGSHYLAIDFSAQSKYQKVTFLGPWDFNWAYSEDANSNYYACTFQPDRGYGDRTNVWYVTAMKAPWFQDIVKARWAELSDSGALSQVTKQIAADIEPLRADLGDENSWKVDCGLDVVNYVNNRIRYLNKKWLAAE